MADMYDRLKAALSDRYVIEGELGRGGMATVYLAEDLKHERKVAIKVLRPELAYGGLGQVLDARREAERAESGVEAVLARLGSTGWARDRTYVWAIHAHALFIANDLDATVDQIDRLLSYSRWGISTTQLRIDPYWEALRTHPIVRTLTCPAHFD